MNTTSLVTSLIPLPLSIGMALTALGTLAALVVACRRHGVRARGPLLAVLAWLAFTALLALSGAISDFEAWPPRFPFLLAAQLVFTLWLALGSRWRWRDALRGIPQTWLIGIQAFRVPVELVLAGLAAARVFPRELTLHGLNLDILTGATAPAMALLCGRLGEARLRPAIVLWNLAGLGLLFNIVFHAALAVPTPLQRFHYEMDNVVMAYFPHQWLPFFLVPAALFLHLVSLGRALARPGPGA